MVALMLEALDLEVVVGARRGRLRWLGGRLASGRAGRLRPVRRCGPGRGRRGPAGAWCAARLRGLALLALEVVPAGVAGAADARHAQGEVVGVRALPQRFFVGDQVLLEEAHQRLIESLHAVGGEALRDRLGDLLGTVLV